MNGADYIANTRLSDRDDQTLAEVGETCERVAASSLPWLLEQGLIALKPAAAAAPAVQTSARRRSANG